MAFKERTRRGLDQPARHKGVAMKSGERGQGVNDVADRGEPDEERLQPRSLLSRVWVS
jgi:hypothetical protein